MAIHGWSGDCQCNSVVRRYSDMGSIGVAIHVLPWTIRVTLDYKVEYRHNIALLDITQTFIILTHESHIYSPPFVPQDENSQKREKFSQLDAELVQVFYLSSLLPLLTLTHTPPVALLSVTCTNSTMSCEEKRKK